jgi:hypothetical protein
VFFCSNQFSIGKPADTIQRPIPGRVAVGLNADVTREAQSEGKTRRQAIVLVHGMGEQVPMATVRDFANAIWRTDRNLHASQVEKAGELFSVPDSNSGSRELRRISTRKSRQRVGAGETYCVRNEFFELYWADSTNDTTWHDFLSWYGRLVVRWPSEVPPEVKWIWSLLWIVNVVFVLTVEIAALWLVPTEIDRVVREAVEVASCNGTHVDWIATYKAALATGTSIDTIQILVVSALASLAGLAAYIFGIFRKLVFWVLVVGLFVVFWSLIVLAGFLLKPIIFMPSKEHDVFWPGFIALVSASLLLLQGFLIKFFGDVARYTIASPGNIVPRQKVRDRGIALIKQLSASGRYDRIVVVAHSLGCIIAYDIVNLLWSDYVSTRNKSAKLVPAADDMASEVQAVVDTATAQPFDLSAFRRAQRLLFQALQKADRERLKGIELGSDDALARWLISDLVTIACPLTHADFLLARTEKELWHRFRWRELSRCPPTLEESRNGKSLIYRKGDAQASRLIHDAAFASVRWTNIHDQPANRLLFLFGDCIAGPIAKWFGKGIVDVKVEPRRRSSALPERLFTHTIYWEMQQPHINDTPRSVRVIRNAVNLLDEDIAEDALIAEAKRMAAATRAKATKNPPA